MPCTILRVLERTKKGGPRQTLQATALVHEAYLRLVGEIPDRQWDGQSHFFADAAEAMRPILVENARRRLRLKRRVDRAAPGIDNHERNSVSDHDIEKR